MLLCVLVSACGARTSLWEADEWAPTGGGNGGAVHSGGAEGSGASGPLGGSGGDGAGGLTGGSGGDGAGGLTGGSGGVSAGGDAGQGASGGAGGDAPGGHGGEGGTGRATIVDFVLGAEHTCVLFDSGRVRCWGDNGSGELGYGNTEPIGDDETPESVGYVSLGGDAVQITAGIHHTCALLATGQVRCWGQNGQGQLGLGHDELVGDDELPTDVEPVDVGGAASQLACGGERCCVVLATGAVRCWGLGHAGELGYGFPAIVGDNETPASFGHTVELGGPVVNIAMGGAHSCALLEGGSVQCWGAGAWGILGYGNTDNIGDNETPASAGLVDVGGSVRQLAAGGGHTCALLETGTVRCWGLGREGQLGYGNEEPVGDNEVPASAGDVEVGARAVELALGDSHTCAVLEGGEVRCWGFPGHGLLGNGSDDNIGDDESPLHSPLVDVGGVVQRLKVGLYHACVQLTTGSLRCWGHGSGGRLGYGNTENVGDDETPASVGDVQIW